MLGSVANRISCPINNTVLDTQGALAYELNDTSKSFAILSLVNFKVILVVDKLQVIQLIAYCGHFLLVLIQMK